MNKRKLLNVLTDVCYLVIFVFATVLCIYLRTQMKGASAEVGFGAALSGVVLVIVLFLAVICAAMALVPLMLKTLGIFFDKAWISILCIICDVGLTVMHAALLTNIFSGDTEFSTALIMLFVCATLSLTALVLNVLSLTAIFAKKQKSEKE